MAFKKATKTRSKLRAALFGPSGAGKTYTSLAMGKGMGGRIALIDSERGSASKYADRFDFDTVDLEKKTVEEYIKLINEAATEGYDVLIIDSLTHAWETLCEEVQKIADARYKGNYWAAWSEGTPIQRKFIEALISYPGHIIATMRSKTEWQTGSEGSKSKPVRVGLSPEQGKGIEYEFDILFEITPEHLANIIKDRTGKFQDRIIEKPGQAFGEELIAWLNEGAPPPPSQNTLKQQCIDGMNELKNIMLATADDQSRLFSDEEYNHTKELLNGFVELSLENRLVEINNLLDVTKDLLKTRYEEWCKVKHPGPEGVPVNQEVASAVAPEPEKPTATAAAAPAQPSKPSKKGGQQSLSEEYRRMLAEKNGATNTETASVAPSTAPPVEDTTPAMYNEPEDDFTDDIPYEEESAGELVEAGAGGELDIF